MNDLQNFLTMLISTNTDFTKRTVKMNNGTVTTYVETASDVEFRFEDGKLEQIYNRRTKI